MRHWLLILFILAFVALGAEGWRQLRLEAYLRDEPAGLMKSFNRDATSDGYIRELLIHEGVSRDAIREPTETVRAALASLPEGALIVVVPQDLPKYNVMYLTLKHLSLPRYAYYLPCDNPAIASIPEGEKIAAVFSYLVEAPPQTSGHLKLLPRLALTMTTEKEAWKPFCSR